MKRKTLFVTLAFLALPGTAYAGHDNDPLDDDAEALACGFPSVVLLLDTLDGGLGACTETFDYQNSLLSLDAECIGDACSALVYAFQTTLPYVMTPPVGTPPITVGPVVPVPVPLVGPGTAIISGYKQEDTEYCLQIQGSLVSPDPVCVNFSGVPGDLPPIGPVPLIPYEELGPTPGVYQGPISLVPSQDTSPFRLHISATANWDKSHLSRRVGSGDTEVWEPVDLLVPSELQWWQDHGAETSLELAWTLIDLHGNTASEDTIAVPYLGQFIASTYRTP